MSDTLVSQMDEYPITIPQGKDWSLPLTFNDSEGDPINLTGWSGHAQIRRWQGGEILLAEMTVVVDPLEGSVTLYLTPTQTRALNHHGYYDVEVTNGTDTVGLLRGPVKVVTEVTKS
jgi:hypothetical protein